MEAMDKRKKERLIKGTVLNALIFIVCLVYIYVEIVPKYTDIWITTAQINETISSNASLKTNGVDKTSFVDLLNRSGRKKEVPDIVFSDAEKLNKVLKKPATIKKDYLAWLVDENGKINEVDKEIQKNDTILGNIIPVFMNISTADISPDIENQITLATFVSYIEKDILGKYSLVSYAPIGISNIVFPDTKNTPINIGSFKINIDFKGKNSNIFALINSIQKSWKLTIRGGKLIDDTPPKTPTVEEKWLSSLSNLLVTVDSFALDSPVNSLSDENKGTMVLEFYVEGMNYQKILILRSLLASKFEALDKAVKSKGLLCVKPGNSLCNETTTANAIATIKGLISNLAAMKSKIDAFKKGSITVDVNKEMDTLSDIKSSLQIIEMNYLKNNAILEKAKKQTSTK